MARLPNPGSDSGQWGDLLNEFLSVEHNPNGTLKASGSLASKADDSTVIHVTGNESISGTKTFSLSPAVPTPTLGSQAANKSYVDSVSGGGGGSTNDHTIVTKVAAYTVTTNDEIVFVNAASASVTITLPTAVGNACIYRIKKTDSSGNTVVVATTSSQTIDGGTTAIINMQYASISVASNGSNWFVI